MKEKTQSFRTRVSKRRVPYANTAKESRLREELGCKDGCPEGWMTAVEASEYSATLFPLPTDPCAQYHEDIVVDVEPGLCLVVHQVFTSASDALFYKICDGDRLERISPPPHLEFHDPIRGSIAAVSLRLSHGACYEYCHLYHRSRWNLRNKWTGKDILALGMGWVTEKSDATRSFGHMTSPGLVIPPCSAPPTPDHRHAAGPTNFDAVKHLLMPRLKETVTPVAGLSIEDTCRVDRRIYGDTIPHAYRTFAPFYVDVAPNLRLHVFQADETSTIIKFEDAKGDAVPVPQDVEIMGFSGVPLVPVRSQYRIDHRVGHTLRKKGTKETLVIFRKTWEVRIL